MDHENTKGTTNLSHENTKTEVFFVLSFHFVLSCSDFVLSCL